MKKMILCGLAGLMSVGLLAGCGLMRNRGDGCCNSRRQGPAQGQCCGGWWAKAQGPTVGAESVVISETKTQQVVPAPTRAVPTKAAPTLPDIPAIPQIPMTPRIDGSQSREKKIDQIDDENAIINREIAAMGSSGFQVIPIPPASGDVRLIDQTENVALPTITVEKSATPAPLPKGPAIPVTQEVAIPTQERIIADNGKEKTVALKSVHIHYGQTDNFMAITGQLQEYRKTLRLRYAAIDQADPYGGVVVLEGGQELRQLRDGQHVRVRGILVPPETRTGSAVYRVKAIEVLD